MTDTENAMRELRETKAALGIAETERDRLHAVLRSIPGDVEKAMTAQSDRLAAPGGKWALAQGLGVWLAMPAVLRAVRGESS